ncbi:MAG: 4Fe-4S dicluster domain-containing protein [Planctomycetaceae bacterium]|nr:4Fe-4S dicluster domain-containing protein [Planctomycetaceae bacterium]MCB9949936.1 4Fe-4S dicluster domain-containing protein [Planctomycetaceae bacterium]
MTSPLFLPVAELPKLLARLLELGYKVIAPTIDQEAIVYSEIQSVEDLPRGWTDEQEPGHYRIKPTSNDRYFDYVVGPHSWKKYLFPPLQLISRAISGEEGWTFETCSDAPEQLAFLGVRACELAAMKIQDRVFLDGAYVDTGYQRRREGSFVIAVNCSVASPNCFCTSMNSGPRCKTGFDLALTELDDGMFVEVGSSRGQDVIEPLSLHAATTQHLNSAENLYARTVSQVSKHLNTDDLRNRLMSNLNDGKWDSVAERCLSCTNCTMVCPTCFCSHVSEVPSLDETVVERQRKWDSCFNLEFTAVHGTPVRNDVRSRYRQWLTHKLATWHDQFGESGCVGCGRCITWCPVGIDLTVEVNAICGGES